MMAISRNNKQEKTLSQKKNEVNEKNNFKKNKIPDVFERPGSIPREKPLTLSQLSHIEPKKFKSQRRKTEIDLPGLRNLLNNNKNKKK
jgi:hypothetical protein